MIQTDFTWTKRIPPTLILRGAIITAVLLFSGYLAPRASLTYLGLLAVIAAALVLLRHPELGLLALPVCALVVPYALSTGTQTSVHSAMFLIPLLFVIMLADKMRRHSLSFASSEANLPIVLFALGAGVSFLAGSSPWNYFASMASLQSQLGGLAVFVLSAITFVLVGNIIKDLYWLKLLTWLFLFLAGLYVLGRIVPGLSWVAGRYSSGATGSLFWIWLVALATGQGFFNDALESKKRFALLLLASITIAVGWFQAAEWASGWMPALITFGVILFLRFPRLAPVGGVGVLVLFLTNVSRLLYLTMADAQGSLATWDARLTAWQIVLETAKANPILGLGPANYYFYVQLFPIAGYYVHFNSHNNYVDLIAQGGLLGLGLFTWFVVEVWRESWSLRASVKDGFARGYVNACLGGLAGSLAAGMLGDWFLPFVYNIGLAGFRASLLMWLFLGGIVSLKQIQKNGSI